MSTAPCRLNPATPAGFAELLIRDRIGRVRRRVAETPRDRGASLVEWVIITAILATLALAIGVIIIQKVTAKANSINLGAGLG
jgi:hypothetical protein